MRFTASALTLGLAHLALSQDLMESLTNALSDYDETTTFQALFALGPDVLTTVLGDKQEDVTILIPSNDAFGQFLSDAGVTDPSDISMETLVAVLQYHVLDASVGPDDVPEDGAVVPTLLTDEMYNNRDPGESITSVYGEDATGQVVFVSMNEISTLDKRQEEEDSDGETAYVRAGMAQVAQITVISDGTWGPNDSNRFHVLDMVLTPPGSIQETVQAAGDNLEALDSAVQKAELYSTLDEAKGITCLAPSSDAFDEAGNPQDSLDQDALAEVLQFHVVEGVAYSSDLEDGQEYTALSGATITVKIMEDGIYFNNAKVVMADVITNNGVVHVLDAIIEADGEATPTEEEDGEPTTIEGDSAAGSLSRGAGVMVAVMVGLALF